MKNRWTTRIAVPLMILLLTGCGAVQKGIRHGKLDVTTKMSATVFLDPVAEHQKTVLVQVRNTSDKPGMLIEQEIKNAIADKGYQIVTDPKKAHYLLQANVLQVGKQREAEIWNSLNGGFGSALSGAIVGATIGGLAAHNHTEGALIGGLVVGAASHLADSMMEVIYYTMTTDLQISEKSNTAHIQEEGDAHLQQGTSGSKRSFYKEKTHWKRYQTRIVSVANKVNLKFEEAEPALKQGLIQSVSGVF